MRKRKMKKKKKTKKTKKRRAKRKKREKKKNVLSLVRWGSGVGVSQPVVIDRRRDRERGASRIDSPDSLNWQLALMSTLILMRGSQISYFIWCVSCLTPLQNRSPAPAYGKWTAFTRFRTSTHSVLSRPVRWEECGVQRQPSWSASLLLLPTPSPTWRPVHSTRTD